MTSSNFLKFSFCFTLSLFIIFSVNVNASQSKFDQTEAVTEDSVYSVVDKMPEFSTGEKGIFTFLNQTINYPAEAQKKNEQGRVVVRFVINKAGKVEKTEVLKGVSTSLDTEALRVIGLLPDWIPGEQNGKKVSVYRILPVMFKMTSVEDAWEMNEKTVVVIDGVKMPENFNTKILNPSKLISASILKPFPKEEKSRLIKLYGKQAENGVLLISSNKDEMYYALADTTSIKANVECKEEVSKPSFMGGITQMLTYIADSIQYPFVAKQLKTQGKVIVRFLVDKSGKISDAKVMKSLDYFLDKEALRVINSMPSWLPGTKCKEGVDILVTMPVSFKLEIPTAEKVWERNDKTIVLLNGERLPATFDLAWLNYGNLSSYKVLQPSTKEINKKLVKEYGKDAVNGVVLIESAK
ncbi:MAG: energy transducer TonB [Paludibacter sp.]